MARSRNPDLIFDDILHERAERVGRQYFENPSSLDVLDRVTIFVTHRCNLRCSYCNGPHLDLRMDQDLRRDMLWREFTAAQYKELLEGWATHGLRNIHFTGGEATMNRDLTEMVRLAHAKGVSTTLTTNGMADAGLYRALVDNGLSEIRVSIDSAVDEVFDRIVGVPGTCARVKRNINYLTDLRDKHGKDIFIILNTCIGDFNVDNMQKTLDPLIELNPDDIKFLVVAEKGEQVHSKASRRLVDELVAYADKIRPDYELLRKKICSMFRKHTSGLKDPVAQHVIRKCFVPLTERTMDSRFIYPCSIYLRYKGQPIAPTSASFDEQQEALLRFVKEHDCRKDAICVDNCTGCCKQYNLAVNKKILTQEALNAVRTVSIDDITQEEIDEFAQTYDSISKLEPDTSPFMIIKPYGIHAKDKIIDYLKEQGIAILQEVAIPDWRTFSLYLYHKPGKDACHRIARNKAYSLLEKPNTALYLRLEHGVPEKKLIRIKNELRYIYGEEIGVFSYDGQDHYLRLNCVHSPDSGDILREGQVVRRFLASATSQ